jgi:hypothetical protein
LPGEIESCGMEGKTTLFAWKRVGKSGKIRRTFRQGSAKDRVGLVCAVVDAKCGVLPVK